MELSEIFNFVINNGIGIFAIIYIIYIQNTLLNKINDNITNINNNLILINQRLKIENEDISKKR